MRLIKILRSLWRLHRELWKCESRDDIFDAMARCDLRLAKIRGGEVYALSWYRQRVVDDLGDRIGEPPSRN